jgi:hypothetical protein
MSDLAPISVVKAIARLRLRCADFVAEVADKKREFGGW